MTTPSAPDEQTAEIERLRQRVAALESLASGRFGTLLLHTLTINLNTGFLFVFDREMRYIFSEGGGTLREGMQRGVTEGRTIAEVSTPENYARLEPLYRRVLDGESTRLTLPAFGGIYDLQLVPVRDIDGSVVAGAVIATDITTSRTTEGRLHLFEQLVERAPDGIIVTDFSARVIYANETAARLYGLDRAEVLNKKVIELTPADQHDILSSELQGALQNGGQWFGRLWAQRLDGTRWRMQVSAMNIRDSSGDHIANAAIFRDVTGEEQAEQERVSLQEQVIASQQAAIRELSTPLIPLAQGVIVMPLVGTIDSQRAQQVLETLLEGITLYQARTAILDITGVRVVDTQVANALIRAAQAARLLGARVVLTGINAEVAQTIVQLGVSMDQIITRSNLQSGINYALKPNA
ncbi:MAG: hypothetical protein OHK0022_54160 [Roseiflexaceae bacterium]